MALGEKSVSYKAFAIQFHREVGGGRFDNMVSGSVCVWWCVGWEEEEGGLGRKVWAIKVFAIQFHRGLGGGRGSITWSVGLNVFGGVWGVKRRKEG